MILVTGATGFVGHHVVRALRAAGRSVRCLVRDRRRAGRLEEWGCEPVPGDLTDAAGLASAVEGCEAVVHLVSIIAGKPEDYDRVMIRGTEDLVAASAGAGVRRIVLMSALGTTEQSAERVPYYGAKWAMEGTVKGSGLEHAVLRPSFVFGKDGGALPRFVKIVRYLLVTPVPGPGTQRIQPIWVDDVAAYVRAALDLPEARATFELAGPDVVTWNELWERLAHALGKRRPAVHIPFAVLRPQAALLERLPNPPLTRDQLEMLALGDNVCDIGPAVEALGVQPIGLDEQLARAAA